MNSIKFGVTPGSSIFRCWLGLIFAAALLFVTGSAHAQCTEVSSSRNVTGYGSGQIYTITLGAFQPGTCKDVAYTISNSTAYPLRFIWSLISISTPTFSPSNLVLGMYDVPQDITIQPGQSFTVTFEVSLPGAAAALSSATAALYYSVGRVYDQIWNDNDFDYLCGQLSVPGTVFASSPQIGTGLASAITPGCVYGQAAAFVNDLSYPVKVYYTGYSDSGSIAPYISGALCDSNMENCGNGWADDGIELQPGESSALFTMLVGMPWYIGNESQNTSGNLEFSWRVEPLGYPVPLPPSTPTGVPTLGDMALALLALGMAGLGMRRVAKRRR